MRDGAVDTVVVDMDGTLLDLHFDDLVWNRLLPERVAARTGRPAAEAAAYVRATLDAERGTLRWYCLDHWSEVFGLSMCELEQAMAAHIRPRPGTLEFLEELPALGLMRVLATNAHPASLARKLARTGLGRHFDHVVSAHELGAPKEEAAFWERLAAATGLRPAHAVLIDDNPAVLAAARACGFGAVFGVLRPSSSGPEKRYADVPGIDALTELLPWLAARAKTKSAI